MSAILSGAALALSLVALYATRVFSKRDFRRDWAFEIIADHHRTALALQAGDGREGSGSRDRVEHLRRSQLQLGALGYDKLAMAFGDVVKQDWNGKPTCEGAASVESLTKAIENEFEGGGLRIGRWSR